MSFPSRPFALRLLLGLCLAALASLSAATAPATVPPREVAPTDEAQFDRLVLANGLRVLLVSDPNFNQSAAALAVGIGQLEDPADLPGLAHFTEHMLFLGTEKFPDEGEYGVFVKNNGGYTNAYTSSDITNYQFEIRHEAFDDALDRFAQFLIAPLFTPEFTAREVTAVDNEVMRHIQHDGRRIYNIMREVYAPDSPESRFTAGNKDTLAAADSARVRAFFEANYSADRMALCLTGAAPLAELATLARRHFSAIPNRELGPPQRTATYLPREAALRLIQVEPVREVRELQLMFPLDATRADFLGKSPDLIGRVLSHANPGGLEAALKDAGLALSAGGGIWERCADYSSLGISVALTPDGADRLPEVLDTIFAYLAFLRDAPFPTDLWEEAARTAALDEIYNDRGEGASLATALANRALHYPLAVAERVPFLWIAPDESAYRRILAQLTPDNLLAVFAAQGVPTDRTEEFYGSAYSYSQDSGKAYQRLLNVSAPADGRFFLPAPNPYLPEHPTLLEERPVKLADEPGLTLYYAPDLEFQRPQTALRFRFVPAREHTDARTAALLALYHACLHDALTVRRDQAERAGLGVGIGLGLQGFSFDVTGFGDSPVRLAHDILTSLRTVEPTPERFAVLQDGILRSLRSFPQTEAFRLAHHRRDSWTNEFSYLPPELIAPTETATWEEVRAAAKTLLAAGKLEGVIHGHIDPDAALATAREFAATLEFAPAPAGDLLRPRELVQPAGETIVQATTTAGANSAYTALYLLPGNTARDRAAALVLGNFVSQPFFNELRTHQQLGYIVGAGAGSTRETRHLYFVIQSANHGPDDLRTRAETFIATLPDQLAALPAPAWQSLVAGARARFEEKPKSIADKAGRFFSLAFDHDANWLRIRQNLAALDELTQKEAVDLLREVIAGEGMRRRLVVLSGEGHPVAKSPGAFEDTAAWKASRRYQ